MNKKKVAKEKIEKKGLFEGFEHFDYYSISKDILSKAIKYIGYNVVGIVNFIKDKTIGYNRTFDNIAISQFTEALNCSPNRIRRLLDKAVGAEVVLCYSTGTLGYEKNYYFLNTKTWKTIVTALKVGLISIKDLVKVENDFMSERSFINKWGQKRKQNMNKTFDDWRKSRDQFYDAWALKLQDIFNHSKSKWNPSTSKKEEETFQKDSGDLPKQDIHYDNSSSDNLTLDNSLYVIKSTSEDKNFLDDINPVEFYDDDLDINIKNNEYNEEEEIQSELVRSIGNKSKNIIDKIQRTTNDITKKISSALAPRTVKYEYNEEQLKSVEILKTARWINPATNLEEQIKNISESTINKLATSYSFTEIYETVKNIKFRTGIQNPVGWIIDELKEGVYQAPKEVIEKEKFDKAEEFRAKLGVIYQAFYNDTDTNWTVDTLRTKLTEIKVTDDTEEKIQTIVFDLMQKLDVSLLIDCFPKSLARFVALNAAKLALKRS